MLLYLVVISILCGENNVVFPFVTRFAKTRNNPANDILQ